MTYFKKLKSQYGKGVFFAITFLFISIYVRFQDTVDTSNIFSQLTSAEIKQILFGAIGFELIASFILLLFSIFSVYIFFRTKNNAKQVFLYFLLTYGVLDWVKEDLYAEQFFAGIGSLFGALIMFIIFKKVLKQNK